MKEKILSFWNTSSYLMRSVIVYTVFSILAITSKLLDDKLGMFSSMVAIGFLVSMIGVVASIAYALVMGIQKKNIFKEIFQAVLIVILFLSVMSSILPPVIEEKVLEEKNHDARIHNVIALPDADN